MRKMDYKQCFTKIKSKVENVQEVVIGFVDNFDKIRHEIFPACREALKNLEPEKIVVETPFVTLKWKNGNAEYRLYDTDFSEYFACDSKMNLCFQNFSNLKYQKTEFVSPL